MHLRPAECCELFVNSVGQPYAISKELLLNQPSVYVRTYLDESDALTAIFEEAGGCEHVVSVAQQAHISIDGNRDICMLIVAATLECAEFTMNDLLALDDFESKHGQLFPK